MIPRIFINVLTVVNIAFVTSGAIPLYNGKCDEEFCACTVAIEEGTELGPKCPDWMLIPRQDSPYEAHSSNGGSTMIACMSHASEFFQVYSNSRTGGSFIEDDLNNTTSYTLYSWVVTDGSGTGSPVIVSYDLADPAPECPMFPPFTNAPSAAPSDTFGPTAITSTNTSNIVTKSFGVLMSSIWVTFVLSNF